jgi:type VI secretion system protein ImpM
VPGAVSAGLYGKIPARGDFVRAGLPRRFTDPWDAWLQEAIDGSRRLLGAAWLPAWMEAPVWCFALPGALCGPLPALGVMLPSVDKAGRCFPLTFAALLPEGCHAEDATWLNRCEAAGRAALERDLPPEQLLDGLGAPRLMDGSAGPDRSVWWTEGSPRVPAQRFERANLPDARDYARMLDTSFSDACPTEAG